MDYLVKLHRILYTPKAIFGMLMVFRKGVLIYSCATLERPWLNNKRMESAVPSGTYPLRLEYSPKFRTRLFELYSVPNRSEAKIHAANYASEINGCIAVGRYHKDLDGDLLPDLANSRSALNDLHQALAGVEVTQLTIIGNGTDNFDNIPDNLIPS